MTEREPTHLLDGLRVVDLSLWQPGHAATQLLADLGAAVVKVEPPGGDRMRPQPDRFYNFNGRKRSVVLDLKTEPGRRRMLELVARAEVVVENFRPGVAERLGVGFEDLRAVNPAIVMCSLTGFGQTGPLATVGGHDHNYQAYAGAFTFPADHDPMPSAMLVGDLGGAMAAAFAITAAVLCARRTGEGEHIDVAIADLLASWVAALGSVDPRRESGRAAWIHPALGVFRTRDARFVELGIFSEDHFWDDLCDALGLTEHIGLDMAARAAQGRPLRAELETVIAARDRDELVETLTRRSIPIAPILTRDEMLLHPHFQERGVVSTGPDGLRALGHPIRYAVHPALPPGRPPELDEHADTAFG